MTQVVTPAPRDLAMAAFAKHAWREAYQRFIEADAAGGLSAHGFAPAVRMGVHRADALQRGLDYAGVGIHEAARVGALAKEAEIVATRETLAAAGGAFTTIEPRTVTAKGISEPLEIVSIVWR